MSDQRLEKNKDRAFKVFIFCIILLIPIFMLMHGIIAAGNATYQCYKSKMNDGFQVKTGWELIKMQFEGNCDYEEIIRIDNNMSE